MGRSYYAIIEITDHGPYVTKLVLPMPVNVKAEAVKPECFSVYVVRKDKKGEILKISRNWLEKTDKELSKGYCLVKAAYPSCLPWRTERGRGIRNSGNEVWTARILYPLQLPVRTTSTSLSSAIIRITQIAESADEERLTGLVFDLCAGNAMKQAEKFL